MKITAYAKIDHGNGSIQEFSFENEGGFQFYDWAHKVCAALPGIGEALQARDESLAVSNLWINQYGRTVSELIGGWAGKSIVDTIREVADALIKERRQHAIKR